jgi:5-methylcytosine-specific restriction endonuclease McrA
MRKDYTGMKFGHLVAIQDTGKRIHRSVVWLYQCDCGRTCEKPTNYIQDAMQSGYEPRCGQCRKEDFDITGDVYGMLTAIRPVLKMRDEVRPGALWEFQCVCGDVVRKTARDVRKQARDGHIPNCGKTECNNGRKHNSRYADGEAARNELIRSYQKGAKKRGHEFALTVEQMEKLFRGNCYYCGRLPEQIKKTHHRTHSSSYIYNGIDRVDNSRGYVPENVVSCCDKCNKAKLQMSHDDFLDLIFRIAQHHGGSHA